MLLPILCALLAAPQSSRTDSGFYLNDPLTGAANGLVITRSEPLDQPKLSPTKFRGQRWEYDWITSGYVKPPGVKDYTLRFRVFSQQRKPGRDKGELVGRMAVRMWAMANRRLRIDHPALERGLRLVDFYLSWGGEAGGEQMIADDTEAGIRRKVNAIYVYDIASFTDPVEMAREVAHEYGHAVLPAVGGFEEPEEWANGFLGEKLFLRWLRDAMKSGAIQSEDVMGVPLLSLSKWVQRNVDPLVQRAASRDPNTYLRGRDKTAMNAYIGVALYAESILPRDVFTVAMATQSGGRARNFPSVIVEAAQDASYSVRATVGVNTWLPLGKSSVEGAKIVARSGGWAQVQPTRSVITVLAKR